MPHTDDWERLEHEAIFGACEALGCRLQIETLPWSLQREAYHCSPDGHEETARFDYFLDTYEGYFMQTRHGGLVYDTRPRVEPSFAAWLSTVHANQSHRAALGACASVEERLYLAHDNRLPLPTAPPEGIPS